jgi:6-phosphogluconolactonase (cycloisomerase 2 family)
MRRTFGPLSLVAISLFCVLVVAGCSNNNLVLRYVTITPQTATGTVGAQVTFTAQAYYSNGTVTNGTGLVLWSSSNPAVATVQGGVATPLTPGTTTITATASGTPGASAVLTVNQVTTITVTPASMTVPLGGTQQYDAVAMFSDGSTADITTQASWSTSNPTAVSIGASTGLATVASSVTNAPLGSQVTINAFLYGVNGTATLTVGAPVASSLQIATVPSSANIAVGTSAQFTATELWTDGSTHPVASAVTWTSGTTTTATIAVLPTSTNTNTASAYGVAAGTSTITATEGTLTGTASLTVATGSAHFAYVSNNGDGTIQWFDVTASTSPYFTAPTNDTVPDASSQAVLNPNGQYLYYTNAATNLSVLAINPSTGALSAPSNPTPIGSYTGLPVGASNDFTFTAVDPFGRFVYVADLTTPQISAFLVNSDGSLTAVAGSPFAVNSPAGLAIDHTGSYLYATNNTNNTVSEFAITQSGASVGALTALSTPTIASGTGPLLATLDPTGTYLFTANWDGGTTNTVSAYSIAPTTGLLTHIGDTTVTGATAISNLVVDPSGKHIYVLDNGGATGQVFGFNLSGGTVGTAITGMPVAAGAIPAGGIVIDPTGVLMAVDNSNDGTISLYTINSTSGLLTPVTPAFPSGSGSSSTPFYVTFYNAAP